jgi:hypothetical protein
VGHAFARARAIATYREALQEPGSGVAMQPTLGF